MKMYKRRATLLGLTLSWLLLIAASGPRLVQGQMLYRELRQLGKGSAEAIVWNPDGTMFAVGGEGGIWLYEADSFTPFKQITDRETVSLVWLPDGKRIAADGPNNIAIYDIDTGKTIVSFSGEMRPGHWSPDGRQWAFFTNDGEIVICNAQTQLCATRYIDQKLNIGPGAMKIQAGLLLWSPDGERIASNIISSDFHIWEVATGHHLTTISTVATVSSGVDWSPDGKWLLVGDDEHSNIGLWDMKTGQLVHQLKLPGYFVATTAVAWNPNGTQLAVVTDQRAYLIWDTTSFTLQNTFYAPGYNPIGLPTYERGTGLAWNKRRLLASTLGSVRLWAPTTGKLLHTRYDYQTYPNALAWDRTGRRLATVHGWGHLQGDNRLRIWNADTGELLCAGEAHHWGVADVAWSPDGQQIATAGGGDNDGEDSRALVWDATTCQLLKTYDTKSPEGAGLVSWSPDGKQLLLGNQLWDVAYGQKVADFKSSSWLWNPRNPYIATTDGKSISILGVGTGQPVVHLETPASSDNNTALTWSPDGSLLASGDSSIGAIKIWDIANGKLQRTLLGFDDQINTLAFSPDGNFIAGAGGTPPGYYNIGQSTDNTIRIWDIHTGQLMAVLVGHTGAIYRIGWSADGERLATLGSDETIRIWEINLPL